MRARDIPFAVYRDELGYLVVRDDCIYPAADMLRIGRLTLLVMKERIQSKEVER